MICEGEYLENYLCDQGGQHCGGNTDLHTRGHVNRSGDIDKKKCMLGWRQALIQHMSYT